MKIVVRVYNDNDIIDVKLIYHEVNSKEEIFSLIDHYKNLGLHFGIDTH